MDADQKETIAKQLGCKSTLYYSASEHLEMSNKTGGEGGRAAVMKYAH